MLESDVPHCEALPRDDGSLSFSHSLLMIRDPTCCRQGEGADEGSHTEVGISCPDATGLGCDVARMLFDFGLRILEGQLYHLASQCRCSRASAESAP